MREREREREKKRERYLADRAQVWLAAEMDKEIVGGYVRLTVLRALEVECWEIYIYIKRSCYGSVATSCSG